MKRYKHLIIIMLTALFVLSFPIQINADENQMIVHNGNITVDVMREGYYHVTEIFDIENTNDNNSHEYRFKRALDKLHNYEYSLDNVKYVKNIFTPVINVQVSRDDQPVFYETKDNDQTFIIGIDHDTVRKRASYKITYDIVVDQARNQSMFIYDLMPEGFGNETLFKSMDVTFNFETPINIENMDLEGKSRYFYQTNDAQSLNFSFIDEDNKYQDIVLRQVLSDNYYKSQIDIETEVPDYQEKFYVDAFDMDVTVNKDGTYDIIERYNLFFEEESVGIFRDISTDYTMEWNTEDGKTEKKYYFPVTDIEVYSDGEPERYRVEKNRNNIHLIIGGDDYKTDAFSGAKQYELRYTVHSSSIDNGIDDEALFYNIVPRNWKTYFNNINATVTFYKPVNTHNTVVKDCLGNSDLFDLTLSEQKIEVENIREIPERCGVTVYNPLPKDYFQYPMKQSLSLNPIIILGIPLLGLLLLIVIYMKNHGSNIIEVVSFNPPKGFNSPMVSYLYYGKRKRKNMYALLFEWANKGYIIINNSEQGLSFKKNKSIDSGAPKFERTLFYYMFAKKKTYTVDDWKYTLNRQITFASETLEEMDVFDTIYTQKSKRTQKYSLICLLLTTLITVFLVYSKSYYRSFSWKQVLGLFAAVSIISYLVYKISHWLYQSKRFSWLQFPVVFILLFMSFTIGALFCNELAFEHLGFIILFGVPFMLSISLVLISRLLVLSEEGKVLMGEVQGLKTFIKHAKKDELIAMQEEHPQLYYDVLPYAYVFGYSKLWLKQFNDIDVPPSENFSMSNVDSYTHYMMMNSIINDVNRVSRTVSSSDGVQSSSSGGSSYSSSGGSSFSGGSGFGGGGGGSR